MPRDRDRDDDRDYDRDRDRDDDRDRDSRRDRNRERDGRDSRDRHEEESSSLGEPYSNTPAIMSVLLITVAWMISIASGAFRWWPGAFISGGLVLAAIGFGIWGLRRATYYKVPGKGMAIAGLITSGITLLLPIPLWFVVNNYREDAATKLEANNLKITGLAFHNYHSANNFISPATYDHQTNQFNPGLSWRVELLPFIEAGRLYHKFRLNEPWDSSTNRPFADFVLRYYHSPFDSPDTPLTRYHIFVGGGAMFEYGKRTHFDDVTDGLSNTIMIAEGREAAPWPKPFDLPYAPNRPLPALGREAGKGFVVLMADGSTRFVSKTVNEATLRAAITAAGNDTLGKFGE